MIRFLILAGYFEMTMYLYVSGKLNQYINLHYSYLAFLSMILAFILSLVQLYIWMKNMNVHSHLKTPLAKTMSFFLLGIPLFITWFFPTVTLNSQTVEAKGYHFPVAAGTDLSVQDQEGTATQYLKPDTSSYFTKSAYAEEMETELARYKDLDKITVTDDNYMEVMELVYNFPDAFLDKTFTFTGFVYNDPDNKDQQFIFRFGIIHCIADSGVYGLLTTGAKQVLTNNTWVSVTGRIQVSYHQSLKQTLPTLQIDSIRTIEEPKNPYVYRVF
ncbi:TIGR03943 family putative permease subunit [Streptococcus sp. DD13]|uniref:TIGR03943 family putative permease subunit n=1 Tax=Streptococcus sp. DD13 TaxID=1777881 RepID=UPI000798F88F|nr:TIGR03943 family protein [Streptococcus sp. DD13]KXT79184.1 ABC transporter, substrate-binding protein [Streptococcus sp. DD13]